MKKTDEIERNIFISLTKEWTITEKDILANIDIKIDSAPELIKATKSFIKSTINNEIKHIEVEGDTKIAEDYIMGLFTIGLHDLDPVDFEGDEPNSINEMFEISSFYILQDIKLNKIKNIRFVL